STTVTFRFEPSASTTDGGAVFRSGGVAVRNTPWSSPAARGSAAGPRRLPFWSTTVIRVVSGELCCVPSETMSWKMYVPAVFGVKTGLFDAWFERVTGSGAETTAQPNVSVEPRGLEL